MCVNELVFVRFSATWMNTVVACDDDTLRMHTYDNTTALDDTDTVLTLEIRAAPTTTTTTTTSTTSTTSTGSSRSTPGSGSGNGAVIGYARVQLAQYVYVQKTTEVVLEVYSGESYAARAVTNKAGRKAKGKRKKARASFNHEGPRVCVCV